jgi:hypothetical protein
MNELLAQIIDAHGGMERWNGYEFDAPIHAPPNLRSFSTPKATMPITIGNNWNTRVLDELP